MKKTARKKDLHQATIAAQRFLPMVGVMFALRRGLREFVLDAGMQTLATLLEQERTDACGTRYQHDGDRRAFRNGHAPGELVLGGRRVSVPRPRARTVEGREVELPSWRVFADEDPLTQRAVEQMVVGVATRKYKRSLEPLPVDADERGASKSAVSRRFVAATAQHLDEWLKRDLAPLRIAALMLDGLPVGEHMVLIALGIDESGRKHVLGMCEGATENTAACKALVGDLVDRGLPTERSILVVIDGSKALAKSIRHYFGEYAFIQRCQVHKKRNVVDHLPEHMRSSVRATLGQAYALRDADRAMQMLENLARSVAKDHPSAAASLREGLAETLTVVRLALPSLLAKTFATTNPVENLNSSVRHTSRNVKRWRDGTMILRWVALSLREAEQRFHRIAGYASMAFLLNALRDNDARIQQSIDAKKNAA